MRRKSGRGRETTAGNGSKAADKPFWREKTLAEMSAAEWESLCDGCARCCLNKLEDEETGVIEWTAVACRLLDDKSCRCTDYARRHSRVPDCVQLDAENVAELKWLPPTCAYRLVGDGRDLYWWHPLVSGDPETVHAAGISVRHRTVSEKLVRLEDWERFIVEWPAKNPAPRRPGARR
jgi:hypothetical protein